MPNSQKPRRAYRGNKYLISSKEYQELNTRLFQVVQQLQQVQAVMMTFIHAARDGAQEAANAPDIRTAPEVSQEEWDQYEKDMEEIAAASLELTPAEAIARQIDAEILASAKAP